MLSMCFKTINSFSNYVLTFIAINEEFTPVAVHSNKQPHKVGAASMAPVCKTGKRGVEK